MKLTKSREGKLTALAILINAQILQTSTNYLFLVFQLAIVFVRQRKRMFLTVWLGRFLFTIRASRECSTVEKQFNKWINRAC